MTQICDFFCSQKKKNVLAGPFQDDGHSDLAWLFQFKSWLFWFNSLLFWFILVIQDLALFY